MNLSLIRSGVAAAVLALAGASAQAAFVDINLAGWKSFAGLGDPANSQVFLNIGAGSAVTGYDYTGLTFTTNGESWLSEFVLSVNNQAGSLYMDWAPSVAKSSGTYGPMSGSWNGPTGSGLGAPGAPFSVADGVLWVTVYETYDDVGLDATVGAGNLRVYYTPTVVAAIPEPATWALMGFGLLGTAVVARRRTD